MQLSLRGAAEQAGTSKSTILRAIKAGKLSASRDLEKGYAIDPSEVARVFPPDRLVPRSAVRTAPDEGETEIRIQNATLAAENKALQAMLEAEKRRAEEIRVERDEWRQSAQRLLLAAPIVTPAPAPPAPTPPTLTTAPPRTPWWGWWRHAS
jgi:hypothetical protein